MKIERDADRKFTIRRCPLPGCGKKYKAYHGAALGACDDCLNRLCDEFWTAWDKSREGK
jgi:hypothetical protein